MDTKRIVMKVVAPKGIKAPAGSVLNTGSTWDGPDSEPQRVLGAAYWASRQTICFYKRAGDEFRVPINDFFAKTFSAKKGDLVALTAEGLKFADALADLANLPFWVVEDF